MSDPRYSINFQDISCNYDQPYDNWFQNKIVSIEYNVIIDITGAIRR